MKDLSVDDVFEDLSFSNTEKKKETPFDAKNYLDTHLKDGETQKKIQIRILPVSADTNKITLPVFVHSMKVDREVSKSGFKTFLCLEDKHLIEGNPSGCPICQKAKQLFEEAKACTEEEADKKKTLFKEGFKLQPKITYIVRVIERGKEDEGVKYWRFNKYSDGTGCYDKLMTLFNQRNKESQKAGNGMYNVFDIHNGRDIILTLSKSENSVGVKTDIIDCGFQTPLSKDENKIQEWVNDSKNWMDMYSSKPYEYLNIIADGKVPYYDKNTGKFIPKENQTQENVNSQNHEDDVPSYEYDENTLSKSSFPF